jgi:hypothetical protein
VTYFLQLGLRTSQYSTTTWGTGPQAFWADTLCPNHNTL